MTDQQANKIKTLVVDDDSIVHDYFNQFLKSDSVILSAKNFSEAISLIKRNKIEIAFVDLHLLDDREQNPNGFEVIKTLKSLDPLISIVVISSTTEVKDAILAFKLGIEDFLQKPIPAQLLKETFMRVLDNRQLKLNSERWIDLKSDEGSEFIIGDSHQIREIRKQIKQVQNIPVDVLVLGESGTGKEMVARTLHAQEGNPNRPFITLNCSAVPKELMESVLFGHEKGSFTGANKKQIGKFELAHSGDIFLDEIGTLSADLQAKLLRVLQEREIEPVGAGLSKKIDFRVIAATNAHLEEMVKTKEFRMDLLFRLNKFIIYLPPLRERKGDIPILVQHFLNKHKFKNIKKEITPQATELLTHHDWPGNIRELENVIENLIITSKSNLIDELQVKNYKFIQSDFFIENQNATTAQNYTFSEEGIGIDFNLIKNFSDLYNSSEKLFLKYKISSAKSKNKLADELGIDRKTLQKKLELYDLDF